MSGGKSARRSIKEWVTRGVLAMLVMVVTYYIFTQSLASVLVRQDAALAYRIAPYDGRVGAQLAALLAGPDASEDERRRSDWLALRALRQDATAVTAAGVLGLNAEMRGDGPSARRLFAYARKLSRRDLRTQLWTIEDAVQRGDIMGALKQYDITLRTKPKMASMLFPVLASASTDSAIRAGLIGVFVAKAPWGNDFADYLASNNPNPRSTAALFIDLWRAGVAVPKTARAGAIDALVAGGNADIAWSYFAMTRKGVDRRRSRDALFAGVDTPTLFDWLAVNDGGISSSVDDNGFNFTASASVGGPLLRQFQWLPPGRYRITGSSEGLRQPAASRPYWLLSCQSGIELGRVELPNSDQAQGSFAGTFTVPAGCPIQVLVLVARPSDAIEGLSGRLRRAQLSPLA